MNRKQFEYDKAVWKRVTKCEQKAEVLANIYRIADRVDERLINEGKPGLYESIRLNNTKLSNKNQEPTRFEAAINSALLVGLVSIIFWAGIHPYFMPL